MLYSTLTIFLQLLTIMSMKSVNVYQTMEMFTWNMRANFNISRPFIDKYAHGCEFICLNDHGLYNSELYKFDQMYPDYASHAKASKHLNEINLGRKRGFGGCAILWKKTLDNRIRPLPDKGTDRMCVVQFQAQNSLFFIISLYLPHQTCKIDDFGEELCKLQDLCIECNALGNTVFLGDTNCHFGAEISERCTGVSTPHARKLGEMLHVCRMSMVDLTGVCTGPCYTWASDNGTLHSYLDHVAVSENLLPYVSQCRVVPDDVVNVSDHLPIIVKIDLHYSEMVKVDKPFSVAWHKIPSSDIKELYSNPLEMKLDAVLKEYNIDFADVWEDMTQYLHVDVETVLYRFQKILLEQSEFLPQSNYNKALKPYWSKELTALSKNQTLAHKKWKDAGRPRSPGNQIFKDYKEAKRAFRAEQRRAIFKYEKENMEKLANSKDIDQRFFWHIVNKKRRRTFAPVQDNTGSLLTEPCEIRKEWTSYFKDLFKSKFDPSWDGHFRDEVNSEVDRVLASGMALPSGPTVTVTEVDKQLSKMKNGKAPGWDNIAIEHFKYGGNNMKKLIVWILNYIMFSCNVPMYCKKGLLIPIPKGSKDSSVKDNNRGLTLLPCIYKLLEKVLIEREKDFLHDPAIISHIQSAGQPNVSSLHTSFLSQEAIASYLNKGMSVFKAFLDAQKAFDTVWIKGLLYKLYMKGLNHNTLLLINSGYIDFKCAVYIGCETGEWFDIERGVHQGGPFSMWLYMVFVNDLIVELTSKCYGVVINNINVTSPAHADDIATMALYKVYLNHLLHTAYLYSLKWQYYYNLDKIVYMVWGNDRTPEIQVIMGGVPVKCVTAWKHVGVTLTTSTAEHKLTLQKRIAKAKEKVLASRGIGGQSLPAPVVVTSHLYWSVCIPSLTYGFDVLPLSESDLCELESAHRQNCKIVQNVSKNVSTPAPLATVGWLSIKSYIMMCKIMYLLRLLCMPDNVYKKVCMFRLGNIARSGYTRPQYIGPIDSMFEALQQYDLVDDVMTCFNSGEFGNIVAWKTLVKKRIWSYEYVKWKASVIIYDNLKIYSEAVSSITMHPWHLVARNKPHLAKKVSVIMSVIMGAQPVGIGCNYDEPFCKLCESRNRDTVLHILFGCPSLGIERSKLLEVVYTSMPLPMRVSYDMMTVNDKLSFLLSCLNSVYVSEWGAVYKNILTFVHAMYTSRYNMYQSK